MTAPSGVARTVGDGIHLGWQYATPQAEPGPPPRRPVPPERQQLSAAWLAAQRREENLISRPLKIGCVAAMAALIVLAGCVVAGWLPALVTAPAIAACLVAVALTGFAIWQGERALRGRIRAEQLRVERFRADQESRLFAWQAEHARQVREWQAQRLAFENQKRWYAVTLPAGIDRVDVAGGTLPGWSALLTMTAVRQLAAGGEVTVLDLSGGAVAADLLRVARGGAIEPAVWVLPADLPRLDLAASLDATDLADVIALSVAASDERGSTAGLAIDTAILERVIGVLGASGGAARLASVTAALRTLAQVGDPRSDVAAGLLTEQEMSQLSALFGQGVTDRVVLERALSIEAQLRKLAPTGSDPIEPPRSRLRVVAIDKRVGPLSARLLGSFVVTALTHLLGQAQPGQPWQHTLYLLGAERLRDDVLDRLTDVSENSRSGLVLAYRSMPPHVRQRIGRGNACVAFMRLGNAEDAKAAAEQIGTEHRFVLSQLTETVGTSVTDTTGVSYTSTVGGSASLGTSTSDSDSLSRGSGQSRSAPSSFLPFGGGSRSAETSTSRGSSQSESLTAGITASTAWGMSTSRAAGDSESLALSMQRSREFLVEATELQRLPPTAMIVSYGTADGRQAVLADANPAIGGLAVATMSPLADAHEAANDQPAEPERLGRSQDPYPNVGPPANRLDWRKR